jgi:hypothetical protein
VCYVADGPSALEGWMAILRVRPGTDRGGRGPLLDLYNTIQTNKLNEHELYKTNP